MSRNYRALIRSAASNLEGIPVPETPEEMVMWLRHHARYVEQDVSQDQHQEEYRLAANMIQELLNNSIV